MEFDLNEMIDKAINQAVTERGHVNILIAGRSGVGKSTLINSVFRENLAETGQGRPVTKETREITKKGMPISIYDTRGLEMADFTETMKSLSNFVEQRNDDRNASNHIHIAWLCIAESSRRVEDAEIKLHEMLTKNNIPVIAVITKSQSDLGFKDEVYRLLPKVNNVISVRAIEERLDEDDIVLKPKNLDKLIELTAGFIPEGQARAFAAAQKANKKHTENQAHKIVASAATAAAAAGASPIPFSDAALLAPIQIGMIAGITSVYGIELSKGTLTTIVSSLLGVSGATILGRTVAVNLLKFFPGAGTLAGAVISGATASAITIGLGESYIKILATLDEKFGGQNITSEKIIAELASLTKK